MLLEGIIRLPGWNFLVVTKEDGTDVTQKVYHSAKVTLNMKIMKLHDLLAGDRVGMNVNGEWSDDVGATRVMVV